MPFYESMGIFLGEHQFSRYYLHEWYYHESPLWLFHQTQLALWNRDISILHAWNLWNLMTCLQILMEHESQQQFCLMKYQVLFHNYPKLQCERLHPRFSGDKSFDVSRVYSLNKWFTINPWWENIHPV